MLKNFRENNSFIKTLISRKKCLFFRNNCACAILKLDFKLSWISAFFRLLKIENLWELEFRFWFWGIQTIFWVEIRTVWNKDSKMALYYTYKSMWTEKIYLPQIDTFIKLSKGFSKFNSYFRSVSGLQSKCSH